MNRELERRIEQLGADALEVGDELEIAAEDDATPEQIEHAKRLMADLLDQYNSLIDDLDADDRRTAQRSIGLKIERLNGLLGKLR
jgi:hypothetical protein